MFPKQSIFLYVEVLSVYIYINFIFISSHFFKFSDAEFEGNLQRYKGLMNGS